MCWVGSVRIADTRLTQTYQSGGMEYIQGSVWSLFYGGLSKRWHEYGTFVSLYDYTHKLDMENQDYAFSTQASSFDEYHPEAHMSENNGHTFQAPVWSGTNAFQPPEDERREPQNQDEEALPAEMEETEETEQSELRREEEAGRNRPEEQPAQDGQAPGELPGAFQ